MNEPVPTGQTGTEQRQAFAARANSILVFVECSDKQRPKIARRHRRSDAVGANAAVSGSGPTTSPAARTESARMPMIPSAMFEDSRAAVCRAWPRP